MISLANSRPSAPRALSRTAPPIAQVVAVVSLLVPLTSPVVAQDGAPVVAPAPASAPADTLPAGYQPAIDQAVAEHRAGNFEEARALFLRAHALYHNARTLRGLGMVEFERRNYRSAADYLTEALASAQRPLTDALRVETEALLTRAKGFLGEVKLDLHPGGKTRVLVDGTPIELQAGSALVLQVGDHHLEIQADGYVAEKRALSVKGGEQQTLRVALRKARVASPKGAQSDPGPWPWVVVGVSGAVAIGGGVLLALAQSDVAKVEDAEKGTRWSEVEGAYDGSPAKSAAGIAMIGVGVAGIATGLVWHFVWGGDAAESSTQVSVGSDRVTVSGRF